MVFRRPLSVCDIQVCAIVFLSVIDCAAMDVLDGVSNDVLVFTTVCGAITAGVLVWQHHQPSSNLDRPVSASGPSNQTTAPQIQVTVRLNSASQGDLSLSLPADTSISDLKMECLSRMDLQLQTRRFESLGQWCASLLSGSNQKGVIIAQPLVQRRQALACCITCILYHLHVVSAN